MNRQTTASTCCYCGVGCGVLIEHDGERILGVSGDPAHPANFGKLCSKGSTLHLTGDLAARALYPELRLGKGLARSRTDWDTALEHAANVFAETIAEHGPDSVAFYISGQLLTEDYYAFNKLARALVGTNNIDSNSRLCMSSAVVGYKRSLGADAPPCSYEDLELSDCVMIVGSNMAYAHPVLFRRLEEAKSRRPQMKVIVIDPRRTDTCDLADLHLTILPGTDVALFHGILHLLLWEDWIDRDFVKAHTDGLAELKNLVRDYTPQMVSQLCGISVEQLQQCAEWVGTSPSFLSLWCMGLNQSTAGSAKNSALINLHLATGQIGRPGAGPFSSLVSQMPWAGAKPEAYRICCRDIVRRPTLNTELKWRLIGVLTAYQVAPGSAQSNCSTRYAAARSRRCGLPVPTRRSRCRIRVRCARRWKLARLWFCKKPFAPPKPQHSPISCYPPPVGARKKAA